MTRTAVPVSRLVHYLKGRLEQDALLHNVLVQGEISNFINHRSGHWYFTLKDAAASIRCVMFASSNSKVQFVPENGSRVILQADVTVYESAGQMQLLVTGMQKEGIGELFLKYEALKKKLSEEGIFNEEHKKPICRYPMKICLITGRNTAARADVLSTLSRRWPVCEVVEIPVLVQGETSAEQICSALIEADGMQADTVLLVRGGGSIEDLWAFNDERMAHIIYDMKTPVITGIGHEVDFTIADFAADLRGPTPTGAAELASPVLKDVEETLLLLKTRMLAVVRNDLKLSDSSLQTIRNSTVFAQPQRLYAEKQMKLSMLSDSLSHSLERTGNIRREFQLLSQQFFQNMQIFQNRSKKQTDDLQNRLTSAAMKTIHAEQLLLSENHNALQTDMQRKLTDSKTDLQTNMNLLDAYSPLKILSRGYSIVDYKGESVTDAEKLQIHDEIEIRMHKGRVKASVEEIKKEV